MIHVCLIKSGLKTAILSISFHKQHSLMASGRQEALHSSWKEPKLRSMNWQLSFRRHVVRSTIQHKPPLLVFVLHRKSTWDLRANVSYHRSSDPDAVAQKPTRQLILMSLQCTNRRCRFRKHDLRSRGNTTLSQRYMFCEYPCYIIRKLGIS